MWVTICGSTFFSSSLFLKQNSFPVTSFETPNYFVVTTLRHTLSAINDWMDNWLASHVLGKLRIWPTQHSETGPGPMLGNMNQF